MENFSRMINRILTIFERQSFQSAQVSPLTQKTHCEPKMTVSAGSSGSTAPELQPDILAAIVHTCVRNFVLIIFSKRGATETNSDSDLGVYESRNTLVMSHAK